MSLHDLHPQARHRTPPRPALFEGRVATAAADPDSLIDVTLEGFARGTQRFHDVPFAARGDTLPARGDWCAVSFTDQNRPVVVLWHPAL